MAIGSDFSVDSNGDIRYTGTVIAAEEGRFDVAESHV